MSRSPEAQTTEEKTIRVAAAVIRRGGWYLFTKRPAHKAQGGFWEFPGGKIESGETAQMALARELIGELDASDVIVGDLVGASASGSICFAAGS